MMISLTNANSLSTGGGNAPSVSFSHEDFQKLLTLALMPLPIGDISVSKDPLRQALTEHHRRMDAIWEILTFKGFEGRESR